MNCPSCSAPAEPGATFCDQCGAILDGAATGPTIRIERTLPAEPPPTLYQQDVDKVWFAAYRNAVHSMAVIGSIGPRAQEFSVKHSVNALVPLDDVMLFLQREVGDTTPDWLMRVALWGAHKVMIEPNPGNDPELAMYIEKATEMYQRMKGGYKPPFAEMEDYLRITMTFVNPSGVVRDSAGAVR